MVAPLCFGPGSPAGVSTGGGWRVGGAGRRVVPVGLLDRVRWADSEGRLGRSGLVLAARVVAFAVEDAHLWGGGYVPVRYRRLVAESGYSRSTVARRLPVVLELLSKLGVVDVSRRVGEPYRVRLLVDVEGLADLGVAWVPWAVGDVSHRLHPGEWSHRDRAVAAGWWSFAGWDGGVNGVVGVEGLAARAGLRPSTVAGGSGPAGLWSVRDRCLRVEGWGDPGLEEHRRAVRYDDYRCSVPSRSGLEGASLRWHGPAPDGQPAACDNTAAPAHGDALVGEWWGGLIDCSRPVTTPPREESSGARPSGSAEKTKNRMGDNRREGEIGPSGRCRSRWTPDRWRYEQAIGDPSWLGPDPGWVGGLARRFGWHVAEQAALETDRVLRLGREVRSAEALATHFARCFARPQLCSRRHRGPCGRPRLDLYRGRRLDEDQQNRATNPHRHTQPPPAHSPTPTPAPVCAVAGRGPGGGEAAGVVPLPAAVRPADPAAVFGAVAAAAPHRLAALAARLATRLGEPADTNNTNDIDIDIGIDYLGGRT